MSTPTSPTDTRPKVNPKDVAEAIESDRVNADDLQKFEQKYNEHSVRGAVPKQVTSDVLECRHFLYSTWAPQLLFGCFPCHYRVCPKLK